MRVDEYNTPYFGQVIFTASKEGVAAVEFTPDNMYYKKFGWKRYMEKPHYLHIDSALSAAVNLGWNGKLSEAQNIAIGYYRKNKTL